MQQLTVENGPVWPRLYFCPVSLVEKWPNKLNHIAVNVHVKQNSKAGLNRKTVDV